MSKAEATVEVRRLAYSIEQAAAALGLSHDSVRAQIRLGRIPHTEVGQRVLVGIRALDEWLTRECLSSVEPHRDEPVTLTPRRRNAEARR